MVIVTFMASILLTTVEAEHVAHCAEAVGVVVDEDVTVDVRDVEVVDVGVEVRVVVAVLVVLLRQQTWQTTY